MRYLAGVTLAALILLEGVCAAYYYATHPFTRPPHFGGAALQTSRHLDSFGFDPITLFTQLDHQLNEDLWAKEVLKLPPRRAGEYRVFLVGGSTAANIRMPPGERIADYLQAGLQDAGVQARVFNFGVPSYTSYNELSLVVGKLVHEKPDMIVAYDGVNDVFYGALMRDMRPNMSDVALHYRRRFYEEIQHQLTPMQRITYLLDGVSYAKFVVNELVLSRRVAEIDDMRKMTARQWADKLASKRDETCAGPLPRISEDPTFASAARLNAPAMDAYALNVRLMAEASREAGIRFVHVLQPTAFSKKKLYPCERYSVEYNNAAYAGMQPVWLKTYEIAREKLRALDAIGLRDAQFVDLSRLTDDMDAYLYDDFCHAWRRGPLTRVVGGEIARRIAPAIPAAAPRS